MPQLPIAAMIAASVIATSSTGGNVAGPGMVVRTGDSYASSNVTIVSSGEGSSTIDIRTNVNGRVREEHREVSGSNGAQVHVSVTATSGPADVEVHVAPPATTTQTSWFKKWFSWGKPHTTSATTTAGASTSIELGTEGRATASIFTRLSGWFSGFFSLFK